MQVQGETMDNWEEIRLRRPISVIRGDYRVDLVWRETPDAVDRLRRAYQIILAARRSREDLPESRPIGY